MIAVEVAQEVGVAALNSSISECIDTDEKSGHDLIERARPLIRRLAA